MMESNVYQVEEKETIIGSDNGLLTLWHQAIIWTNADLLSVGPMTTNLENRTEIQ